MPRKSSSAQNTLVQATVFKKCDRAYHKPDSNKLCAAGTCQHTCGPAQVGDCPTSGRCGTRPAPGSASSRSPR
jgi:hypothetical protein